MKKFLMIFTVVLTVCIISAPAFAGKMGIGYNNSGTPLGGRMWLTDTMGLDFAVGFNTSGVAGTQNFGFDAGILIVMAKSDPVSLQLRGGMAMNLGAVTNLYWPLGLNVEYFVAKNLSLNMGLGIQVAADTAFRVSSFCNTIGGLGVIYYLP